MLVFNPKKGFKVLLPIYGFLTLILIPTFIILLSTQATFLVWVLFIFFTYAFVALISYFVQKTTKYWIDAEILYFQSLFLKGQINILSIRKLDVNATCWLSGKPATSNTKGIFIHFDKYNETFITPESNEEVVDELLKINPSIEVKYLK